eukprot:gene2820-5663_t
MPFPSTNAEPQTRLKPVETNANNRTRVEVAAVAVEVAAVAVEVAAVAVEVAAVVAFQSQLQRNMVTLPTMNKRQMLLLTWVIVALLCSETYGGYARIFARQGSASVGNRIDVAFKFRLSSSRVTETRQTNTLSIPARWEEWLDFTGTDISQQVVVELYLRVWRRSWLQWRPQVVQGQVSHRFSGCDISTATFQLRNRENTLFVSFDVEYTPRNVCDTNNGGCDGRTSLCECVEDNAHQCQCKTGFQRFETDQCLEINNCELNNGGCDSDSTSCHKTGPGTHICTCKRGFSRISDTSCSPIDPCVSNPGICGDNSICKNIAPDEYVCSCFENFISKNGADCVPINPCTTTVDCGSTAICVFEGPGNYSCVSCPDGFEISDPECTINNPCMDETICGEHEECVFLGADKYRCQCKSGYSRNQQEENTARSACIPINRCEKFTSPCGPNSACSFTGPGLFNCTCDDGFISTSGSNRDCVPIDPCEQNGGGCGRFSNCEFLGPNQHSCNCDDGFLSPWNNGTSCQMVNPCLQDNGGCEPVSERCTHLSPKVNTCECRTDFLMVENDKNQSACIPVNNTLKTSTSSTTTTFGLEDFGAFTSTAFMNSTIASTLLTTTNASNMKGSSESQSTHVETIIGAIIASLSCLLIITALVIYRRRRRLVDYQEKHKPSNPQCGMQFNSIFNHDAIGNERRVSVNPVYDTGNLRNQSSSGADGHLVSASEQMDENTVPANNDISADQYWFAINSDRAPESTVSVPSNNGSYYAKPAKIFAKDSAHGIARNENHHYSYLYDVPTEMNHRGAFYTVCTNASNTIKPVNDSVPNPDKSQVYSTPEAHNVYHVPSRHMRASMTYQTRPEAHNVYQVLSNIARTADVDAANTYGVIHSNDFEYAKANPSTGYHLFRDVSNFRTDNSTYSVPHSENHRSIA